MTTETPSPASQLAGALPIVAIEHRALNVSPSLMAINHLACSTISQCASQHVRGKPPDEIVAWRRSKTKPLLEAFFRWIDGLAIPPTGELRDAFKYIQRRKASLMLFIDDARLSPDNNETERVLRGVVVGRKNHYGSRSVLGTKVAALLYSSLDSAQLAGINPHQYLRVAVDAALDGTHIPLPHELVA